MRVSIITGSKAERCARPAAVEEVALQMVRHLKLRRGAVPSRVVTVPDHEAPARATRKAEQGTAEIQMPSKYGQTVHDFYFMAPGSKMEEKKKEDRDDRLRRDRAQLPPQGWFSSEELFAAGPCANFSPSGLNHLMREAQQGMQREGLYKSSVEGMPGPATQEAVFQYQYTHELELTGRLDQATLNSLSLLGRTDQRPEGLKPVSAQRVGALRRLQGKWVRQDRGYQIHVLKIYDNGEVKARYHNPTRGDIRVAAAYLLPAGARADFFMKLDPATYYGSEYTLRLSGKDELTGQYLYDPDGEADVSHITFDRRAQDGLAAKRGSSLAVARVPKAPLPASLQCLENGSFIGCVQLLSRSCDPVMGSRHPRFRCTLPAIFLCER